MPTHTGVNSTAPCGRFENTHIHVVIIFFGGGGLNALAVKALSLSCTALWEESYWINPSQYSPGNRLGPLWPLLHPHQSPRIFATIAG